MDDQISKTVAVFARPFTVPGFGETLPAGAYEIETDLASPPEHGDREGWKASVQMTLHARTAHPGLARTLTVSRADLDHARARDKLTGRALSNFFLEDMLADPIVRLVMEADGVTAAQLRHLFAGETTRQALPEIASILAAENEGMPTRPERGPRLPARHLEERA